MAIESSLVGDFNSVAAAQRGKVRKGKVLICPCMVEIEVCELAGTYLDALAKKTQVIITTVGPYVKFGTPVVEACVTNGTHYIDWWVLPTIALLKSV